MQSTFYFRVGNLSLIRNQTGLQIQLVGCIKIHLSSIHSSLALPQAYLVSCGALLFSSLPSPQPALCSKGLFQYISWPTPVHYTVLTARITLLIHSSTLHHAVLLSSPVHYLSHTNHDHYLKGRGIPLVCCFQLHPPPCTMQSFPRVCLVPSFSPTAADVEQLTVGAMQCSEWRIWWL